MQKIGATMGLYWKFILAAVAVLLLVFSLRQFSRIDDGNKNAISISKEDFQPEEEILKLTLGLDDGVEPIQLPDKDKNDKWIVITSIFAPTEDIKKLAKIEGWRLVVVADTKTPKDWNLPGVVFLSLEKQNELGLEVSEHIGFKTYARKNMGYLYSIMHGARYIYDTDDDNHPYDGKIKFDTDDVDVEHLVYHSDRTYYNIMAHFGQSTLWPRGYPLNRISDSAIRTYKKCKGTRPLVQQGVVDGDPDLDAIQRLTRKDADVKFDVKFDPKAPDVVLPSGSYTSYNCQNTISSYDAFFSMFLPVKVTLRVTDIWRAYFAQRLLWDIGGHLKYHTATAYQDRSPHDFLKDFIDELDLYNYAGRIVDKLRSWKPADETVPVQERLFQIYKEMYKLGILQGEEVLAVRAWIRDLVRLGYKWPDIRPSKMVCQDKVITFQPVEQGSMYLRAGKQTINVTQAVEFAKTLLKKV